MVTRPPKKLRFSPVLVLPPVPAVTTYEPAPWRKLLPWLAVAEELRRAAWSVRALVDAAPRRPVEPAPARTIAAGAKVYISKPGGEMVLIGTTV